jgi:predicted RNA-binding protein with PUA-like domain
MAVWLLKTEPSEFSWSDLVARGPSVWDGVSNPAARIHLRNFRADDRVWVYHTGGEKAIVGSAVVTRKAFEDPKRPGKNDRDEVLYPVVEVRAEQAVATPLTLAAMKADARFKDFDLLRLSRLSVVPVPAPIDKLIKAATKA